MSLPTTKVSIRMDGSPLGTKIEMNGVEISCSEVEIHQTHLDGTHPEPIARAEIIGVEFEGEIDTILNTQVAGRSFLLIDPNLWDVVPKGQGVQS